MLTLTNADSQTTIQWTDVLDALNESIKVPPGRTGKALRSQASQIIKE